VIRMRGWSRSQIWPDTGLSWVQTSPNIPTWETTFVYLCTGLIDNAGINNGTGFTKPFFLAGTAGLDGTRLATTLNALDLPGVWFRAAAWSPIAGFWAGKELSGVELVVFEPRKFVAVRTAVEILCAIRDFAPRAIDVRKPADLDRDWGTPALRQGLTAGTPAREILARWESSTQAFREMRSTYLLY